MTAFTDCVRAYTAQYDYIKYDSTSGDNDHDGLANRADLSTGGDDCSGWTWNVVNHCSTDVKIPLTSSAGYAFLGKEHDWIVPHDQAQPGDMVIYDKYGNAYASNGPRGHVGVLVDIEGAYWLTSESRGGTNGGVGLYTRPAAFWVMVVRVPTGTQITAEQLDAFFRALEEMDVEHGMAADAFCFAGGRVVNLDRWGGLHASNGASFKTTGSWAGHDVARRIIPFVPDDPMKSAAYNPKAFISGYVMDHDGGFHPFAETAKFAADGHQVGDLLTALPPEKKAGYWPNGKILPFNET